MNNIEADFFKEKENLKNYYEKEENDELEFYKDELCHKEKLLGELKNEFVQQRKSYEHKIFMLEDKVVMLLDDVRHSKVQLQFANKDIVELQMDRIVCGVDQYFSEKNLAEIDNRRIRNTATTGHKFDSVLFSTLGESGIGMHNCALGTGMCVHACRKSTNPDGTTTQILLNDSENDVMNLSYLDTLEGHSEQFLK